MSSNLPSSEFYLEQEARLEAMQDRFSYELFVSGAVSRAIFGDINPVLTHEEVNTADYADVDFFERYRFVPQLGKLRIPDDELQILYLGYLPRPDGPTFRPTQTLMGRFDSTGTMAYAYQNVDQDDVDRLFGFAYKLMIAKHEGVLPDLRFGLTTINNPYNTTSNTEPKNS